MAKCQLMQPRLKLELELVSLAIERAGLEMLT